MTSFFPLKEKLVVSLSLIFLPALVPMPFWLLWGMLWLAGSEFAESGWFVEYVIYIPAMSIIFYPWYAVLGTISAVLYSFCIKHPIKHYFIMVLPILFSAIVYFVTNQEDFILYAFGVGMLNLCVFYALYFLGKKRQWIVLEAEKDTA